MHRILFYTFLACSLSSFSQYILNFNLFLSKTSVVIKFTINSNTPCSGYRIMYSSDSITYIPARDFQVGQCPTQTNTYDVSFTHSSPALNQTNYYMIDLQPLQTSQVKRIYVPQNANTTMVVYPNPIYQAFDSLHIKLLNTSNLHVVGFLYSQQGFPIRDLDLKASLDKAAIDVSALDNGIYMVWLTDGSMRYSSKFIIHK